LPPERFRRITVAIDGSAPAVEALGLAIDLAHRYGSELSIVAVAPIIPVYVAPTEPLVPAAVAETDLPRYRALVDGAVRTAAAGGVVGPTGAALEGSVADEILGWVEQHPSDLLIVGSRGLSTTKRILLGSVSAALVNHAPCPVLVVRGASTKAAG
jgi:nucleotide-binding universal stress UspA family protein